MLYWGGPIALLFRYSFPWKNATYLLSQSCHSASSFFLHGVIAAWTPVTQITSKNNVTNQTQILDLSALIV
jgi:hypothetical protein